MLGRLAGMGLRNLGRNRRRTGIAAVALGGGLALCSVTWVFAEGMLGDSIDKMVLGQTGHLQVQPAGQLLVHGPSQSPRCSVRRSSRARLRASVTRDPPVDTSTVPPAG